MHNKIMKLLMKGKYLKYTCGIFVTGGLGFFVGQNYGKDVSKYDAITSGLTEYHVPCTTISTAQPPIFSQIKNILSVNAATKIDNSLALSNDLIPEPAPNASRISQIMRYGFPSLTNVRSLDDYVLSYDTRTRIPYWVLEHLTEHSIAKNDAVDRSKCDFREDLSIHEYFRSSNTDYKKSGYDRGHMAAAGNHRLSQDHCQQTFLLSNMAPQVGKGFNRDKWNDLEHYCRKLVRAHKNVYVCTGPLFLPRREDDGNLYVRYKVLGDNHVAVPTHFFKVVVSETSSGDLSLESFVMPNAVIDDQVPVTAFYVPVDVVERASGLLLFDKVSRKQFKKINGKSVGWF